MGMGSFSMKAGKRGGSRGKIGGSSSDPRDFDCTMPIGSLSLGGGGGGLATAFAALCGAWGSKG